MLGESLHIATRIRVTVNVLKNSPNILDLTKADSPFF